MVVSARWKRAGLIAVAVVAVLLSAMGAAPYVIDVEAYKPAVIEAVREATGRDLVIDGRVRLRMFPVPGIGAGKVRFANAVGSKGAQMVDVRWIAVRPSWLALLQGRVEIGSLTLYRPTIVLETDARGVPNWQFQPGANLEQAPGAPSGGFHLAIGRFSIVRGTVNYTNPQTKQTIVAENVNASAWVDSLEGPFRVAGSATVNGVPLELDWKVGAPTPKGNETSFDLQVSSGTLKFDGRLSKIAADATVDGKLSVATGLMTDFIADIISASGKDRPVFQGSVIGRFSFDGRIEMSPERLAVRDFIMTLGGESATGSMVLDQKPTLSLEGRVALPSLDLEKWLTALNNRQLAALVTPPAAPPAKGAPPAKAAPATPLPSQLNASVSLDVERATYRSGTIRNFSIAVEASKGALRVRRLKAILPGETTLLAEADYPHDEFRLSGENFRQTLEWLGIDVGGVPADKLRTLEIKGRLTSVPGSMQVADATIEFDDETAKGSATLGLAMPIVSSMQLQMDRFDLDAYLPRLRTPVAMAMPDDFNYQVPPPPTTPTSPAPTFGLKAKLAKVVYRGETVNGVESDATVQGNLLKLNDVKVADLMGAKASLRGQVKDFGTAPQFDLTFNVAASDTDRLLKYLDVPKPIDGKIGAASASGRLTGTPRGVAFSDLAASALGMSARASGKVALNASRDFEVQTLSIESRDGFSASGSVKGNASRAAFNGDLEVMGVKLHGTLDGTVGDRPRIVAALEVPGTLDFDRWMGGAARAPALPAGAPIKVATAPAKPIDLSRLRAFDASLSLRAAEVAVAALKVSHADLDATLANGTLKLTKLNGQLYGGTVALSGTIDAKGRALSVDLKGDAEGIHLGEMLRGTRGNASFGNSHLRVSLDGKLSAHNIQVQGQGSSADEIRHALSAGASLSGYVHPAVVEGSRSFAQFATSLAGIFSDDMAFSSMVLQSFIDRPSPFSGQVQLHGDTVILERQTVQGQSATAYVTSRTDLGAETTDTTIRIAGHGEDYTMTFKGPLASPAMTTGRTAPR